MDDDGTNAVADAVSFGDLVEGPISAIDTAAGTITVLGQLIIIDADTSFDDEISTASIDGLKVNETVEVRGFFLADGSVSATRIERKSAGTEFEVTGHVSNLSGTTFQINDLTVDFSMAQLDDFPAGSPENEQLVEVKGNNLGGSGELLATRVEREDFGGEVAIRAFVDSVSDPNFTIRGVPIETDDNTEFRDNMEQVIPASDFFAQAMGRLVEAEGSPSNGGILASKVEMED